MKKVSFRVRNFEKEQYLTYNIDNEADLDEDVLDYLEDEEPEGIVPIIFDDENEDFDTFSYDITDKIHLLELSNQEINAEMVLMVMRGLILSLKNMAEYRIPLSYLVLHKNYIYIDSDYKVEFICIPLEDMQEEVDITGFLRGFLASLRFDSSENGDYVAKLLTYINNPAIFTLHSFLTLVEDLMEDYGIDIPEDAEAGIYVDYQEVDENAEADNLEEPEEEPEDMAGQTTILTNEDVQEPEEADAQELDNEEAATEEVQEESDKDSDDEMKEEEDSENQDASEEEQDEEPDASEDAQMMDDAKELIDRIKQQVLEEKQTKQEPEESPEENPQKPSEASAGKKKTSFKTKEPSAGVVIHDELDDFLAEKEKEEKAALKEDSGIKMKKNIKVSRASIVKSTQDELKAADDTENASQEDGNEEETSGSILSQTIGSTGILKGSGAVPKANPYLVRVNTEERIMITKQTFKIGKASMGVDYTVKGNGAVSRVHAIISNRDDVYYIRDNKSTNHTYVNGKILDEGDEELLTHDSKIMLGDEEFVFKLR